MKRWILLISLALVAAGRPAPVRAAGIYFDDSHPELLVLGNTRHYEVAFRKANGSIAYIIDNALGGSVTHGPKRWAVW